MTSLTPTSRDALLDELETTRYDMVVIGGGITGAGVARDGAMRGLRVALLEAHDFAAGTSSRSSKLIHGGLRYLAMGEIRLVRETALERKAVHAMAPHLAEPCWMVVPTRNSTGMLKFRAAIATYEKLGAIDEGDRHQVWSGEELAEMEPLLRADIYKYGVAYREYLTDDARLVLAVLRAGVAHDATVANFTPVTGLVRNGQQIAGVACRCSISGREIQVRGDVVVNAAGPWVTDLARMEQDPPRTQLHLSRGIHIVVNRDRFPVNHLVILSAADKRSTFAIPRGDTVAIGTTDTSYEGNQQLWPEVESDDVAYLLEPLRRYFDAEPITPSDIVATWSGVRPLVAQHGKQPKEISRKDEVSTGPGGMINIAGGKLTGFRLLAANIVNEVAERLGSSTSAAPGPTPVPGGGTGRDLSAAAAELAGRTGVDRGVCERLVRLYGSEADDVIELGADRLDGDSSVVAGEVAWAVDMEAALYLEDVVFRRTRVAWYNPSERDRLTPVIAGLMAGRLGWDADRTATEIAGVRHRFSTELEFQNGAPQ